MSKLITHPLATPVQSAANQADGSVHPSSGGSSAAPLGLCPFAWLTNG
jgi:hypothetical protein